LLTKNVISITSTQFLREIYKKTHLQYMLYSVIDRDLNKDGRMDYLDITSLYISNLDGTVFTKLTGQYHNYVDGKLIIQELKYYYRTIEDINKDGIFNKVDKYHYYYIDFACNPYKIVEYFPLKLITK
jgi:hypothetical protein